MVREYVLASRRKRCQRGDTACIHDAGLSQSVRRASAPCALPPGALTACAHSAQDPRSSLTQGFQKRKRVHVHHSTVTSRKYVCPDIGHASRKAAGCSHEDAPPQQHSTKWPAISSTSTKASQPVCRHIAAARDLSARRVLHHPWPFSMAYAWVSSGAKTFANP